MSSGCTIWMCARWCAVVARPVRDQRGLDRIQRLAHRAIPKGVEVRLEAERVQLRHRILQQFGIDERDARVVGGQPVRIQVGRQGGRREVLDHAVLHDLHRGRREAPHGPSCPGVDESLDLLEPAVTVPPQCPDDTSGEFSAGRCRDVRVEGPVTTVVLGDVRVLPRRDAERVEVALRDSEPGRVVLVRVDGSDRRDEAHRSLVQRARGLAIGGAFDAPVPRVRRVARDARQLQRARVDPRAVSVTVRQERRTIGDDGVERLLRRCPAGEHVHVPAAAEDPRRVGVGRRVLRDHPLVRVEDVELGQVAAEHLETAPRRVDVRVLESGQQHASGEVHHLGVRAAPRANVLVGADRDDRAALHGHRRSPSSVPRPPCIRVR